MPGHPAHVQPVAEQVEAFAGIAAQVEDHRDLRLDDRLIDALAVTEPSELTCRVTELL